MKLIKVVTDGLPEGYRIVVNAEYRFNDWHDRYEVYVKCRLFSNSDVELQNCGAGIPKPKAKKFIFFKNNVTWKQTVEAKMDYGVEYLAEWLEIYLKEKQINDGLLDSLDKL